MFDEVLKCQGQYDTHSPHDPEEDEEASYMISPLTLHVLANISKRDNLTCQVHS